MIESQSPNAFTEHAPDISRLRFRERVRLRLGACELLLFRVGRERFGVELRAVDEAIEVNELRAVPGAPSSFVGMFTLRDRLVPLFSAAEVLGPAAVSAGIALVMRTGARQVALAVDEAEEVVQAQLDELREPPPGANDDEIVVGLLWRAKSLITVVDARAVTTACMNRAPVAL